MIKRSFSCFKYYIECVSLNNKGYMFVRKQQTTVKTKRIKFYNVNVSILNESENVINIYQSVDKFSSKVLSNEIHF